jgi:hypothetical protein
MGSNYIDNRSFSQALGTWAAAKRTAIKEGVEPPSMPENVAEQIMLMVNRIGRKANFAGYTYNDDMKANALLCCVTYLHNFDLSRTTNGFAFVTTTINNALIRFIQGEQKQSYVKALLKQEHEADRIVQDGDSGGYEQHTATSAGSQSFQEHNGNIIATFEAHRKKKSGYLKKLREEKATDDGRPAGRIGRPRKAKAEAA